MKKTILVIVIVLMLICIIALSFRIYSVVAADGAQASDKPAATEAVPTETPASPPASDAASASAEASSADAETLRGLMADFGDKIQAGSAGCSLKEAGQAVRLINWGIAT